jgi:peptide/nickel transport system permease protein
VIRYLIFRFFRGFLTLFGVLLLTFLLGRVVGDPVALLLPQNATLEQYQALRTSLGLDQPLYTQFGRYFLDVLQGDLGVSTTTNRSALTLVLERVPTTLALAIPAFLLSTLLGIPLGILAAIRRNSLGDRLARWLSLSTQSLPSFFVGILLILIFGVWLRWTPTFGSATWRHFILPTITLSLLPAALILRLTRSSLLEVINEDYIRTARAKGLHRTQIIGKHALRNALLPLITVLGLQVASLLGGAVIVETVFAWPGVGTLAVQAISGRDYAVIQAVVLLSALTFVAVNLIVDLTYGLIDPRIESNA